MALDGVLHDQWPRLGLGRGCVVGALLLFMAWRKVTPPETQFVTETKTWRRRTGDTQQTQSNPGASRDRCAPERQARAGALRPAEPEPGHSAPCRRSTGDRGAARALVLL